MPGITDARTPREEVFMAQTTDEQLLQPIATAKDEGEAHWILDGDVTFEVGGKTIEASAGDFVFGPRDVPHRYTVGDAGSRMLFILTPGGFEELVRATSDPAPRPTPPPPDHPMPDEQQMKAAQTAAGC